MHAVDVETEGSRRELDFVILKCHVEDAAFNKVTPSDLMLQF